MPPGQWIIIRLKLDLALDANYLSLAKFRTVTQLLILRLGRVSLNWTSVSTLTSPQFVRRRHSRRVTRPPFTSPWTYCRRAWLKGRQVSGTSVVMHPPTHPLLGVQTHFLLHSDPQLLTIFLIKSCEWLSLIWRAIMIILMLLVSSSRRTG